MLLIKELKGSTKNGKKSCFALCQARYEMPVEVAGSIFNQEVNPLDVQGLEKIALNKVKGLDSLTLYVTGLTVALVATLNACKKAGVKVVLMHYNREDNNYYPQEVL